MNRQERIEKEQERLERWFSSDYRKVYKRTCPICGRIFYTRLSSGKYCPFGECKTIADTKRRKENRIKKSHLNICPICGNNFISTRKDAKYCSNACKQKAYRNRVTDI